MARSRNVKPALFDNEILGTADPLLTLLFVGLWCLADREGRLEDRPLKIKAQIFPYRDNVQITVMLQWLHDHGFVRRYMVGGTGYIDIPTFKKHQSPHHTERKSECPEFPIESDGCILTVKTPGVHATAPMEIPLIPDSGLPDSLIPETLVLKPDSGTLTPELSAPGGASSTGATRPAKSKAEPKSAAVWESYRLAYLSRYKTEPVRNATVNAQLSAFVGRVGAEVAPLVAAFYVQHNDRYYVQQQHPVGLMLKAAEGLHTQWASGRKITGVEARQIEKTSANLNAHDEAMAMLADKRNRQ